MARARNAIWHAVRLATIADASAAEASHLMSSLDHRVLVASPGGVLAAGERPDVIGGKGVAADTPIAARDLLDQAPDCVPHVLALDRHHRLGESFCDLSLLWRREGTLNELYLNEHHAVLLVATGGLVVV